jgi:hypothetical protein
MSYLYADRVIANLRALLQDGDGIIRAITATRFAGDLPPGLEGDEEQRRGLHVSKPIEVRLDGLAPHPQRLTQAGTLQIHLMNVTIRIVRTLPLEALVDDDLRDDVQAQGAIDAGAVHDVLSWPPNLALTVHTGFGVSTGCIGARWLGSSMRVEGGEPGKAMQLTSEHRYEMTVTSAPAST